MLLATFPIIIMLCFSYSLFLQRSALYRNRSIEIYLFWHYNSSVDFYSGSVDFSTKGQVCQISPSVISLATSASPDGRPSSGGDRKKWEAGVPLVLSAAQQTLEDTSLMTIGKSFPAESEQAHSFPYNCSLSITLSLCLFLFLFLVCLFFVSEQTAGEVIQMAVLQEDAPRKMWGASPDSQVLKVLKEAELQPLTQPLETLTICEDESSSPG